MTTSQTLPSDSAGFAPPVGIGARVADEGHLTASCDHAVQFYDDDAYLLDAVADFVGTGLQAGEAGIVILTSEHRDGLHSRLHSQGLDVSELQEIGRYISLDATEVLPTLLKDEAPDEQKFRKIIGKMVTDMANCNRPVRVFGELVALLALGNNYDGAVRLEQFWNQLQRTVPFSLLCAYPMAAFDGHDVAVPLSLVCDEHAVVTPAESYSTLATEDERSRKITELQRRANRLEAEITLRLQAEESLRAALEAEQTARREAESALRFRDDFLSVAAHDLKTPVTVLSGHAQLIVRQLQRDKYIEQERLLEAVDEIAEQASNLTNLVNHLLDTSRLEAGIMTIERRSVDLAALTRSVVATRQTTTESHIIECKASRRLAATLDPLRIEQVLNNLIDNAVKYSPDGSTVEVALSRSRAGDLVLSVRDYGIGIPVEMRDQIFERFYQAHGDRYRSGLGLGLFITKQIIELHGGSVRAEFPPDGGSRFVVNLSTSRAKPHPHS